MVGSMGFEKKKTGKWDLRKMGARK